MIQLSKNYSLPERAEDFIPIKIVSVGGAGLNALDRIVLDGLEGAEVLAVNTDVQSLASSVAAHKVQLGRTVTRGLGAGGDPEVGYQAAFESTEEIGEALTGARMIFICAGLGGAKLWPDSMRLPMQWFASKTIRWATWSRRTQAFIRHFPRPIRLSVRAFVRL
ncbi:MAG: hypothetical protein DMF20_05335 [Verrucomicrobia bacterium]|nr:MAG: hypothetical protein DMF20_05335 [Verrucomicrobiota bacterium]